MEYITKTTEEVAKKSNSQKISIIHNRVKQVRMSEKMGVKFMQRWEEVVYARQDGMIECKKSIIANMLQKGMEISEIISLTACDQSLIDEVIASQKIN